MKKLLPAFAAICCLILSLHSSAQVWKWVAGSRCPKNVTESWPIALDAYSHVYAAGQSYNYPGSPATPIHTYFGTDSVNGSGYFVVSSDSDGNYRWVRQATGNAGISGLVTDHDHVYVFGNFFTSMSFGGHSISAPWSSSFCAKLDTGGNVLWLKKIGDSVSIFGGAIDTSGHVYLAGGIQAAARTFGPSHITNTSAGYYDNLVLKMDSAGNFLWATGFGGTADDQLNVIAVDAAGNSYVSGTFASPAMTVGSSSLTYPGVAAPYGVVAALGASGTPLWGDPIIDRLSFNINSICVDNASNVYVAGGTLGTTVFGPDSLAYAPTAGNPYFLVSYNSSGTFRWLRSNGTEYWQAQSVVADGCGNIWICGGMRQFSYLPDTMFVMAYDVAGNITDSFKAPTGGDDQANLAVDNRGNMYICGDAWSTHRTDTFMFGAHPLVVIDSSLETLFLAKISYTNCPNITLEAPHANPGAVAPRIYPNPATDECTISIGQGLLSKAEVYDMAGKLATGYTLSGSSTTISTQNLKPGFYTCVITGGDNERYTQKLVIMRR